MLKCADSDFVDFLRQCFIWEPEKRIAPEAALRHRWVAASSPCKSRASVDLSLEAKARTEHRRTEGANDKPTLNKTLVSHNNVLKISVNRKGNSGSRDRLLKLKETLRLSQKKGSVEGSESSRIMPFSLFNKEGINYPGTTKHKAS